MAICSKISAAEIVSVANFNSPGQVVIAGNTGAVEQAAEAARQAGARRVVMLDVSVPSHCILMKDAAENFSRRLADVSFADAQIPVIQNVDAVQRIDAGQIRNALLQQLHQPVRWTDTIQKMKLSGVEKIIECGPGKVLTGLIKRIDRELKTVAVYDNGSLATALSGVQV